MLLKKETLNYLKEGFLCVLKNHDRKIVMFRNGYMESPIEIVIESKSKKMKLKNSEDHCQSVELFLHHLNYVEIYGY